MAAAQVCVRVPISPLQSSTFSCDCRPSSSKSLVVWGTRQSQIAYNVGSTHTFSHEALRNAVPVRRTQAESRPRGVRASGMSVSFGGGEKHEAKFQKGDKVKVCQSAIVFHVPKTPEVDLQSWEGEVADVLYEFKGKPISANLPYKVKFQKDGKPFFAHLREDEIELAS